MQMLWLFRNIVGIVSVGICRQKNWLKIYIALYHISLVSCISFISYFHQSQSNTIPLFLLLAMNMVGVSNVVWGLFMEIPWKFQFFVFFHLQQRSCILVRNSYVTCIFISLYKEITSFSGHWVPLLTIVFISISIVSNFRRQPDCFLFGLQLFKKAKARGYGDHDTAAIYRATD